MKTNTQTIALNETFYKKDNTNLIIGEDFNSSLWFNAKLYHQRYRKKRSTKETISFLEGECFELVVCNIIGILRKYPQQKMEFIENHMFESITPDLEEQLQELINSVPPTDTIITPTSLTFVFDVPDSIHI
jgi:hypothetical protein